MKPLRNIVPALLLAAALTLALAGCGGLSAGGQKDLPAELDYSVGTPGDIYHTTADTPGGLDNGYTTYQCSRFEKTTAEDYDRLLEHYRQSAIGNIGDNRLLFDWGILVVNQEDTVITVEAYIE